ncbi:probable G-protein coupled receptor 142 [Engraulis encrasicolus]|uniref:probable G-protein coupled receptor 142 n=1 Tax=Engraulis encrasicolus TaxID=184585 RepID=UPI002FD32D69
MIHRPNVTVPSHARDGHNQDDWQRSECVLGYIPLIYYSTLLCVGVPVNILTLVALSRLASRTKKAMYVYLLALTSSDILSQLFIIFVGFLLETTVFHRDMPPALLGAVSALEFASNHASIWATVPLTVDRYVALCHPLQHRQISYPARARRIIAGVLTLALASGVPFFWWSDMWRASHAPTRLDGALIWTHVTIIYFLPCSIFLVLNSLIIHRLRQRQRLCEDESASGGGGANSSASSSVTCAALPHPHYRQQHRRRLGKTTAMLLAVTSVFSVLWAPRTAVVMYHLYVRSVYSDWRVHLAYDLANMLAMLNTAVNFFLYCFVSKPFRAAVKDVLLLRDGGGGGAAAARNALRHQQVPPHAASTSSISSGNNKRSQQLQRNCDDSAPYGTEADMQVM